MSTNFTGVTFAQQKVLPSDDAIIRRAILPDGILYGCELSYSGSTLTMGAGQLLICGRQIRHPSAQNWAVVDATSGFARLVLTIDLTLASSKETFDQVVDSIEYASAEDGFPELEQTDVNVSGTRYQVAACVVSLGTGGITGIVSQLGVSQVKAGAGDSLNFSVVGGETQPTDYAENTIWVYTDQEITGWIFSATEPAVPEDGMVWFMLGTFSPVEFNALKKNGIQVYPLSAKQYIGSEWMGVTTKTYQNGEWVDWMTRADWIAKLNETGWARYSEGVAGEYVRFGDRGFTRTSLLPAIWGWSIGSGYEGYCLIAATNEALSTSSEGLYGGITKVTAQTPAGNTAHIGYMANGWTIGEREIAITSNGATYTLTQEAKGAHAYYPQSNAMEEELGSWVDKLLFGGV